MKTVTVNNSGLMKRLNFNMKEHIEQYQEACRDYKTDALKAIDDAVAKLKRQFDDLEDGEIIQLASVSFKLPFPESHEEDYLQAIEMLNMSVDSTTILSHEEFRNYVLDQWDWKDRFNATRMSYSNKTPS